MILGLILIAIGAAGLLICLRIPYARDYRIKVSEKGNAPYLLTLITAIIVIAVIAMLNAQKFIIIYWSVFILAVISIFIFTYWDYRQSSIWEGIEFARKPFAKVKIAWDSHKQGGLRAPKFRVVKGEIFPACFMNPEQTPISGALCVVLENIKWEDRRHCVCSIKLVLDNVSEKTLFVKNNEFYLYHDYQKIAKGTVV